MTQQVSFARDGKELRVKVDGMTVGWFANEKQIAAAMDGLEWNDGVAESKYGRIIPNEFTGQATVITRNASASAVFSSFEQAASALRRRGEVDTFLELGDVIGYHRSDKLAALRRAPVGTIVWSGGRIWTKTGGWWSGRSYVDSWVLAGQTVFVVAIPL